MSENVYLRNLREQYEQLQNSIAGLQSRAAEQKRELTNEEMRSVVEQGEKAKALYTQIEDLSEIELRNAKVAAMNARVQSAVVAGTQKDGQPDSGPEGQPDDQGQPGSDGQFRRLGGATTRDRDPGFYVRGGEHSFLGDQWRSARMGDKQATERLTRHARALIDQSRSDVHLRDVLGAGATTAGAGLVPPVWLAEQFAPVLHQRLRVASVLRQIPWAGPFAWSIPVAGTVALGSSTTEGVNTTETTPFYTTLTVTPTALMGYAEVSRQMLEASNPAVDAVIWGDLMGNLYDNAETLTVAAIEATTVFNSVTCSGTTGEINRNAVIDAIAAVSTSNGGDADVFVGRGSRWATFLKLVDSTGRPLIISQRYAPSNAIGLGGATQGFRSVIQGDLENLAVVTSPTVAASRGYVLNSQELLFSMSPPMQFRFDEPVGPALVRIGVWGYAAIVADRRGAAISKILFDSN